MTGPMGAGASAHYELRVAGHLDRRWSAWFDGMTLTLEDDGTTTLRGPVTDQAALHGYLVRVRDLGAFLISVNATTRGSTDSSADADRRPTEA